MIRKHKRYDRPRKLYDKVRILAENDLLEKYGLKSKREVWKAEAQVKYYRTRAKELITADTETQEAFFDKLRAIGLKINSIADVLALNKEAFFERRLPTFLVKKGMAATAQQARQMVVHKKVRVGERVINVPSYLVHVDEENLISIQEKTRKVKEEVANNE